MSLIINVSKSSKSCFHNIVPALKISDKYHRQVIYDTFKKTVRCDDLSDVTLACRGGVQDRAHKFAGDCL